MKRTALILFLVLMLLGGVAAGCSCEKGCVTTVTCIHALTGETRTFTVDGCTATCPCWYEVVHQQTWCPGDR